MPKTTTKENNSEEVVIPASSGKSISSVLPWVLLVIILIAAGAFVYHQKQQGEVLQKQLLDLQQNPQKANEEEAKVLLDKVGQIIELPNEQPTIATVSDLAPLKDQPFFAHAQIGDKVLIYTSAKKAILYRPSTSKVIEVAPVNLDNTTSVNSDTTGQTISPKKTTTPKVPVE